MTGELQRIKGKVFLEERLAQAKTGIYRLAWLIWKLKHKEAKARRQKQCTR